MIFMILKLFNYIISDVIDTVILKNGLIYTVKVFWNGHKMAALYHPGGLC